MRNIADIRANITNSFEKWREFGLKQGFDYTKVCYNNALLEIDFEHPSPLIQILNFSQVSGALQMFLMLEKEARFDNNEQLLRKASDLAAEVKEYLFELKHAYDLIDSSKED